VQIMGALLFLVGLAGMVTLAWHLIGHSGDQGRRRDTRRRHTHRRRRRESEDDGS
jgi:hypothetical protein